MNCRTVTDNAQRDFNLTIEEEKFMRAIERLEKLDPGRLRLFGNGQLSIRINDYWERNEVLGTSILCEGGDGGDNY